MIRYAVVFLCFISSVVSSCKNDAMDNNEEKILLAEVESKKLFLEDVRNMIHEDASPQDSALIVNAYVDRWVRDQLLMAKAEQNIPVNLNVDKLVADYRSSLILNNYERLLMESQLDSTISDQDLIQFYEANKEQYILEKPIARIVFVKLRPDSPNQQQALAWWNDLEKENLRRLRSYADRHAAQSFLEDTAWIDMASIMDMVPSTMVSESSLKEGKEVRYQDGDYLYLLKVLEVRRTTEVAPLPYIRDQATRAILHKRQIALIERTKDQLYDVAIRKNNVKIYTQ
jgi:hypothetical protein